jgi:hypothetical protein
LWQATPKQHCQLVKGDRQCRAHVFIQRNLRGTERNSQAAHRRAAKLDWLAKADGLGRKVASGFARTVIQQAPAVSCHGKVKLPQGSGR